MFDDFSMRIYFHRKNKIKKKLELREDEYLKEEIVNHYEKCNECEDGFVFINSSAKLCEKCLGSGKVLKSREIIVKSKKELSL